VSLDERADSEQSTLDAVENQSLADSDIQTLFTDPWGLDPHTGARPAGRSMPIGSAALIQRQRQSLEQQGYTPEQIERGLQPLVAAYGDDASDDW